MKSKILIIVEGAKADVKLMSGLLQFYEISDRHEIVSYETNIYDLYDKMFKGSDPSNFDILQVMKERERNLDKKKIFDNNYSDILLVFDYDPQDPQYSENKILEMMQYFNESSDMGKLYVNYPMVESFYHMKALKDLEFNDRKVTRTELEEGKYKDRVAKETFQNRYAIFVTTKKECDAIIKQINKKVATVTKTECDQKIVWNHNKAIELLEKQNELYRDSNEMYVLCTCSLYILDYNSSFVFE